MPAEDPDLAAMAAEVIELDAKATKAPWLEGQEHFFRDKDTEPWQNVYADDDGDPTPWHLLRVTDMVGHQANSHEASLANRDLVIRYRTLAPALARDWQLKARRCAELDAELAATRRELDRLSVSPQCAAELAAAKVDIERLRVAIRAAVPLIYASIERIRAAGGGAELHETVAEKLDAALAPQPDETNAATPQKGNT